MKASGEPPSLLRLVTIGMRMRRFTSAPASRCGELRLQGLRSFEQKLDAPAARHAGTAGLVSAEVEEAHGRDPTVSGARMSPRM